MNSVERGALVGMVMGDGCLRIRKRYEEHRGHEAQHLFQLTHSIKQLGYLQHKAQRINTILGGRSKVTYYDTKLKGIDTPYKMCRIVKVNKYFGQLRGWLYPEGKKTLTPRVLDMLSDEGFAYWFLDDGHTSWRYKGGAVSSASSVFSICKSVHESSLLQEWMLDRYGIDSKMGICNNHNILYIRTQASKKLHELVRPFTPQCMLYKVDSTSARQSAIDTRNGLKR